MKNIGRASLVYHFSGGTRLGVAIANFDVITDFKIYRRRFVGFDEKYNVIYFEDIHKGRQFQFHQLGFIRRIVIIQDIFGCSSLGSLQ